MRGELTMSEKINWSFNIQVVGGPKLSESQTMEVEAYDKIQVTVEDGASDKKVELQPGASGQVCFLMISSDQYEGDKLTYKVNDSA